MLLPIIGLSALAGLSFLRKRPESNGAHPDPSRLPRERLPRIMLALEAGPEPPIPILAAALIEARENGLAGAAAIFEEALARAEERQATREVEQVSEEVSRDAEGLLDFVDPDPRAPLADSRPLAASPPPPDEPEPVPVEPETSAVCGDGELAAQPAPTAQVTRGQEVEAVGKSERLRRRKAVGRSKTKKGEA